MQCYIRGSLAWLQNNIFPKPPALIFLIDVSYNNIKSGMVHLLCGQMKSILQLLPKDEGAEKSNMRVGFVTYNNTVHFYNIKVSNVTSKAFLL
jgi:protein transport protein SEC24